MEVRYGRKTQEILLGAGELYMYEFNGTEIPVHAEIETDEHNVGHCSGGFSLEYKPEIYDVKDWFGKNRCKVCNR